MIKVKDHKNLMRDPKTGVIINVDKEGFERYMERKTIANNKNKRIETLEAELSKLKSDMTKILKYIGDK